MQHLVGALIGILMAMVYLLIYNLPYFVRCLVFSLQELPTYENCMIGGGNNRKSPNQTSQRPPEAELEHVEPPAELTTTRRSKPRTTMRGIHGWGGGIFDTSSSDQDSTSSDD